MALHNYNKAVFAFCVWVGGCAHASTPVDQTLLSVRKACEDKEQAIVERQNSDYDSDVLELERVRAECDRYYDALSGMHTLLGGQ